MTLVLTHSSGWMKIRFSVASQSQPQIGNIQRIPVENMMIIASSWPFATWGIHFLGLLQQGKKQIRFLLVAIDYFTKWVEAKPLVRITEAKIQGFVQKNIICRFEISRIIILDNGRQINNSKFKDFYHELRIKNHFSSLGTPRPIDRQR